MTLLVNALKKSEQVLPSKSNSLLRIENSCIEPLSLVFPRRVERHVVVEVPSLIGRIIG
jgi:hypothetical protein